MLVLVLLPILTGQGGQASSSTASVAISVGVAILKVAALVGFTLVVGRRAIPALLGLVARTRSRELFTLTVLVLALGIAVGSAMLFGASMALGAFLAGMVVGQSEFSSRAASIPSPTSTRRAFTPSMETPRSARSWRAPESEMPLPSSSPPPAPPTP